MIHALLLALQLLAAPTTGPATPRVVFRDDIGVDKTMEIVLSGTRPTTKPATTSASSQQRTLTRPHDFTETYQVRLMQQRTVRTLYQYDRGGYLDRSSERLRYRVLSAALIGDRLFIAEKSGLGTTLVMIRSNEKGEFGDTVTFKYLVSDSDAEGPIITTAKFKVGSTWTNSELFLNEDGAPTDQRAFRLGDAFADSKE